jgi:hypothetical protein
MTPQFELPHTRFGKIRGAFRVQMNDPGPNVRAANIDCKHRFVGLEDPWRRKLNGAEQPSLGRVDKSVDAGIVN